MISGAAGEGGLAHAGLLTPACLFMYFASRTPNVARIASPKSPGALGQHSRPTPAFSPCFATRKPILLFEFDGALFKFKANTPAFEPLFQLPPRNAARRLYRHNPDATSWPPI